MKLKNTLFIALFAAMACNISIAAATLPEAPTKLNQLTKLDKTVDEVMPRIIRASFNGFTAACLVTGFYQGSKDIYSGNGGLGCFKLAGGLAAAALSHTTKGIVTDTDFKKTVSAFVVNFNPAEIIRAGAYSYKVWHETKMAEQAAALKK